MRERLAILILGSVSLTVAGSCGPPSEAAVLRSLIERLALSDLPATERPFFPVSESSVDEAHRAAEELERYGLKSIPFLLDSFQDRRHSIVARAVTVHDVRGVCLNIFRRIVLPLPKDYRGYKGRTGGGGASHSNPLFTDFPPFGIQGAKEWWQKQTGRPLREIQVEMLDWLIEQETKNGFESAEQEAAILVPLRRQRKTLAAEMSQGR